MAELEKKPVKIVETVLRDAHQSLIATRLSTEQMLPIVDKMDKVGYHAVAVSYTHLVLSGCRLLMSFRLWIRYSWKISRRKQKRKSS